MFVEIQAEINKVLGQYGRINQNVTLVAVTKQRSIDDILLLFDQGARHFGENYVQEALTKITAVPEAFKSQLIWHLIGPLQSNKAKRVAQQFNWVQSVSTLKLARLLSQSRPVELPALQVCVQVNIDQAPSKHGVLPDTVVLAQLLREICDLPRLELRGLMVIPDSYDREICAKYFKQAQLLFQQMKSKLVPAFAAKFDTLSMGMSNDYSLAIASGSTMVRIGTALFGVRV